MNRVTMIGRLTKKPELRYTPNGVAVTTFNIAVNRVFLNQHGEREADFFNCVVWRKPAENVANYCDKGSLVGLDGKLQTRSYEGSDGKKVYVTEIVCEQVQFLDAKKREDAPKQQSQAEKDAKSMFKDDPFANAGKYVDISDDDLPF